MFLAALLATSCLSVAHVPDGTVAFQQDKSRPVDLNPGIEIDTAMLRVPVIVDVLRSDRELREQGLLAELKLADIPVVEPLPPCPKPKAAKRP
jgi:hypothetical protein